MLLKKQFLVTGASGFLGRHLLQALQRDYPDIKLIPLLRNTAEWQSLAWVADLSITESVVGDLTQHIEWMDSPLLAQLDGIFHLAAIVQHSRTETEKLYQCNVQGTLNMVKFAAEKKCRLLFLSTSGTVAVFKSRVEWADEHSPYLDKMIKNWPYYHSKLQAERAARTLADELKVDLLIIRPPMLLGPGDHRYRSTRSIIRYLSGQYPFLIRGGMHFVDIRDAANAIVAAMLHPQPRAIYHLSGTACSLDSFFRMVKNSSGVAAPRLHIPYQVAWSFAALSEYAAKRLPIIKKSPLPDPVMIEMAGKYWDVRSAYAAEDLGFINRHGQETINDTVQYLLEHRQEWDE